MRHLFDEEFNSRHRAETITGVIFFVICGLLIVWSLGGCVRKEVPTTPEHYFRFQFGKCWNFDSIERKVKRKPVCATPSPIRSLSCSRIYGHGGLHHAHGMADCYVRW